MRTPVAKHRPTIADVARAAGVSKGLVSFALNDRPGVSATTRKRILAAADELGWRPSLRARSLSTDRAFALGLVIARDPQIIAADPFFPALIAGIETALAPVGQALVLSMVASEEAELASYRQLAAHDRVDGVIITDLRQGDPRLALALELGLQAVTLGHPDAPSPFPAVALDDDPGIRSTVEHLVGLGHRRIAHVAGPTRMLHGSRRRNSFTSALKWRGLHGDLIVETDFSASDGARATAELLSLADPPTAIVYSNDPMAIAGMGVAQRAGLRIPDDLSITGFDDSDVGQHLNPSLTTVTTAAQEWGRTAASALLRLIEGDAVADIELAPAQLVIRGSSGSPTPRTPATAP
jgi:DNA-binding LacI/PurR family transcriptional regulator